MKNNPEHISNAVKQIKKKLLNSYLFSISCHSFSSSLAKLQGKEPLIIYQMGKVGSSSILRSLKALKAFAPIYHVHYLTHKSINNVEKVNKFTHWANRYLLEQINKGSKKQKWKLVTLIREPIARNISAFFQNIELPFPDLDYQEFLKPEKIDEIIEYFLKNYPHKIPLTWLDSQIKSVFDINVYETDFPKTKGYKIYRGDRADLLLLKLENLNQCAEKAFQEFLGVRHFSLVNKNISSKKKYYNVYRRFLDSIKLPSSYINKMYTSKYTQHFYTEEEINLFKSKWVKPSFNTKHSGVSRSEGH